ncbi:glycosyltransferase [Hymenobacter coccineus]|uniref:Mannosyl transferase n=1 Tax=Hymenobacter coccineus TaxID=1908235 RepID=A0A1G1TH82_9BACT|nr:glycosyltransferase [Hymenobacter coccineus]OGX90232.1 mannosyl transferase [Hymenobacter coccineus]
MHIVFFDHPAYLEYLSIPKFTQMLVEGMKRHGHTTEVWKPTPYFLRFSTSKKIQKWLGYLDQYLVFPTQIRKRLKLQPADTLFVFADQAQGPWVPLLARRPHVIHCHDFMAQHSALGRIPENPASWTGRQYQKLIYNGYSQGENFISVSEKTRKDLELLLPKPPKTSEMVYNGLNKLFKPYDTVAARSELGEKIGLDIGQGYLLHVGGNQWYKNRLGVIELYDAWRSISSLALPLLLIGSALSPDSMEAVKQSKYKKDIHVFGGLDDKFVHLAYAGATVFLFPSLAEGFGWPIAEAMASGCLVMTTGEDPMTEVAGNAGFLVPRRPYQPAASVEKWAVETAVTLEKIIQMSDNERDIAISAGLTNALRFDIDDALNQIESIYTKVLQRAK